MQGEKSPASVITILNLKGGVGKTHTSWLLAGMSSELKHGCLCIDLDTQGNLTRNLLTSGDTAQPGVEQLFHAAAEPDAAALVRPSTLECVDVLPASFALGPFDLASQQQWEAADLQQCLVEALAPLRMQYDYILLDCPPRLSLVSFAALVACDHVIIPLEAADWGAQGVTQVAEAVHYVQRTENPRLNLLGYLTSRFKTARSVQHTYMAELRQQFGDLAFDTVVPDLAGFEKSVSAAFPVNLRAPSSREAGIARALFAEVTRRIDCRRGGSRRSRVSNSERVAV